jgi:hypothetical protein
MAKRKTTSKKNQKPLVDKEKLSAFADLCKKTFVLCCKSIPMVTILGASAYYMGYVWKASAQDSRFKISIPEPGEFQDKADMPSQLRDELLRLRQLANGVNILDVNAPLVLRSKYNKSQWIETTFPFKRDLERGEIVADFVLRYPAAQIRNGGYYWTVDNRGRVLPTVKTRTQSEDLPIIYCHLDYSPEEGKLVKGEGIKEALQVIDEINDSKIADALNVKKVVVRRASFIDTKLRKRSIKPSLRLYTASGAIIKWGTSNTDADTDEILNREKINMLQRALAANTSLERGDQLDISTKSVYYSNNAAMR